MAGNLIAFERLIVFCSRRYGVFLAICSVLRAGAGVQEPRLRYGNAVEHASNGSIEDIVVEGGAADRAERVGDGSSDGCEDCASC